MKRERDEAERVTDDVAQQIADMDERVAAAEHRADAMELTLRKLELAGRMQHEVWGASQGLVNALLEARAALAQQPADHPATGEPEHRATLAVVPDAYCGWNITQDSRIVSGPHRSQTDAVEAMRKLAGRDT